MFGVVLVAIMIAVIGLGCVWIWASMVRGKDDNR